MRRLVYEICPHCESEITGYFNTSRPHREVVCPECGQIVMLCSICPVKHTAFTCDKNEQAICMMSKSADKPQALLNALM